jgi:hypothetical protein
MTPIQRAAAIWAAAAALLAVGCSESTSPGTTDPSAMATAVSSLNSSFSQNAVFQSLAALSGNVVFGAATARLAPGPLAASVAQRDLLLALTSRSPTAMLLLFPVNIQGKTFQWDTASGGRYRILDSTLTGAPGAGVRFILYAVDTATHRPRLPLTTTGYVDLSDVSSPSANAVHIVVKVGTQTASDYTIANVKTTSTDTLRAAGYVVDVVSGGAQVTFNLAHALSLADSSLVTNYLASSNGATVTMNTSITGASGAQGLTLDWLLQKNGSVELTGRMTPDTVNAQFKLNGNVFATATASANGPASITGAGGRVLTAPELLSLEAILVGFESIYENLTAVFGPAVLVF